MTRWQDESDWKQYQEIKKSKGSNPVAYAELILNGDPETYLKTVTEYKSLDN